MTAVLMIHRDEWGDGQEFTFEHPRPADMEPWVLPWFDWEELRVHPEHYADAEAREVWRLFGIHSGAGMTGGPLPDAGGILQQPAVLMDAFDILAWAVALCRKKPKAPGG